MGRFVVAALFAVVLVALTPARSDAHGDVLLVDEVLALEPGGSAHFDGELHYHRLVGHLSGDGTVQVRLVASRTGEEVLTLGRGTQLSFNELVRCCDEAWAPHRLVIENVDAGPVTVTARASFVHDDLAVMVDGAESGTRLSIVVLGGGWWVLVWRARRRRDAGVPLRRPVIGLAVLTILVLGLGGYATVRYGVGGAPSVVAGNAAVPILPMNDIVSRASLLMGLSMIGWALVGVWWVRARPRAPRRAWIVLGVALAGAVLVVAASILIAYGGPLVQSAWFLAAAAPILAVLATSDTSSTTP